MDAVTFAKLNIGDKPAGYYSDCLWACIEEGIEDGTYRRDVADIVLARAQLALCNDRDPDFTNFLMAYNELASARNRVERDQ